MPPLQLRPDQLLPHDSYLINLGQPDPEKRRRSLDAFIDELERCRQLGLTKLNFHPRAATSTKSPKTKTSKSSPIASAKPLIPSPTSWPSSKIPPAGNQRRIHVHPPRHHARSRQPPGRVGVCLDTCHSYAAGYDLKSPEGYEKTFDEFKRFIGFELLEGMHLNDSKSHTRRTHSTDDTTASATDTSAGKPSND